MNMKFGSFLMKRVFENFKPDFVDFYMFICLFSFPLFVYSYLASYCRKAQPSSFIQSSDTWKSVLKVAVIFRFYKLHSDDFF